MRKKNPPSKKPKAAVKRTAPTARASNAGANGKANGTAKAKRCAALHEGPTPPAVAVIFGASGDLAKRKLIPSLYNLTVDGLLSKKFAVVGVSRTEMSDDEYRAQMAATLKEFIDPKIFNQAVCDELVKRFYYLAGDTDSDGTYDRLKKILGEIDAEHKTGGNYLYYLAVPPSLFAKIPASLNKAGLTDESKGWRRVVIEKPFGRDLPSAIALNASLEKSLNESQIYRIDHYLGKETVQNIMVMRFANGIFEPIWNRRYINSVQITVSETLGVEERAPYYEQTGALRDMVPNHLFQLLSLIGMEPPTSFMADDVRNEKVKVLKAIKPMSKDDVETHVVRGQYGPGEIGDKKVHSYRADDGVKKTSTTETFVSMKLDIDNWRWAGVPFYLRTGKRMAERLTEIVIEFRCAPVRMFSDTNLAAMKPDLLVIQIQPEEKIALRFAAKVPGPGIHVSEVKMDFDYTKSFGITPHTGYETLLYDCMNGDATLFMRADQIEAGWKALAPVIEAWSKGRAADLKTYRAGSWGPKASEELIVRDHRQWRDPDVSA